MCREIRVKLVYLVCRTRASWTTTNKNHTYMRDPNLWIYMEFSLRFSNRGYGAVVINPSQSPKNPNEA